MSLGLDLEDLKLLAAGALSSLGAVAGGGGLWAFVNARLAAREAAPSARMDAAGGLAEAAGEFAKQVASASAALIEDLRRELKFVREQQAALIARTDLCEAHRKTCEAQLAELRREVDEMRRRTP